MHGSGRKVEDNVELVEVLMFGGKCGGANQSCAASSVAYSVTNQLTTTNTPKDDHSEEETKSPNLQKTTSNITL
ncbi:hypothetical protein Pmani_013933 [Petrolisthes manimaculis]|uniref:Uncharacterized protein n=1 Tax=Petrolisthes manimaculis TaxID=1843537 RepID=A0AAE1UDM4_9EUCA|nr:hypothetical protein Pmani_013933 [Petrolisthes manimaculis]